MKNTIKYSLVFLCAVLCISLLIGITPTASAADEVASGTHGSNLTWSLDSDGTLTISGSGAMEKKGTYTLYPWYRYYSTITKLVIEDGVTSISDYAFSNYYFHLTSVSIPESVQAIGAGAFNSSGLTSVVIPSGVTTIEDGTFGRCGNLESVVLPNSITKIGSSAFGNCIKLKEITIPQSVTNFGNSVFAESGLTSVEIPYGITSIPNAMFSKCGSLNTVTIPCSVKGIQETAFHSSGVTDVIFLGTQEQWEQVYIHDFNDPIIQATKHFTAVAQGNCGNDGDNLIWLLSNDGILTIAGNGDMADYLGEDEPWWGLRESINSIIIENGVTSVGRNAFWCCVNMSSVTLPNSLLSLKSGAFSACHSLHSITLPEGLRSIEEGALGACEFETILIPASVSSIGRGALGSIKEINVSEGNAYYCSENGVLFSSDKTKLIQFPDARYGSYNIPNGVTTIDTSAFQYSRISTVTIPSSVTLIGEDAFTCCTNLTNIVIPDSVTEIQNSAFAASGLVNITLPNSITRIRDYTFWTCNNLASITVPSSVTAIGKEAFYKCSNLTEINFIGTYEQWLSIRKGDDAFTGTGLTSTSYHFAHIAAGECGSNGDNLTWTLDQSGVLTISGIGEMAEANPNAPWYNYRATIKTVIIESGVTNVGDKAFRNCEQMTSIAIPEGVTSIDGNAFVGCSSLKNVIIPSGVKTIGNVAFSGCSELTSISIPTSVTSIGFWAFTNCSKLIDITIPDAVTTLKEGTFSGCTNLSSISIPSNLAIIEDSAFAYCSKLTSLSFPATLASIGSAAFLDCSGLKEVTLTGNCPAIAVDAFANVTASIYYPYGNEGYSDETMLDYGGNKLTWIAVCTHVSASPVKENEVVATCTEDGSFDEVVYCSVCGEELKREHTIVQKLGHLRADPVLENEVPATYESDGSYDMVTYCSRCDAELDREHHVIPHLGSAPAITSQPISVNALDGEEASFTIEAEGEGLNYQWYYLAPQDIDWTAIDNGTNATLTILANQECNGYRYYCKVSNEFGFENSRVVTLTVKQLPPAPTITAQPENKKVVVNKTATFTISAQGTGLTYQWYEQAKGSTAWTPISGTTSDELTITAVADMDGNKYRCEVTGEGNQTVTSNAGTLTVVTKPKITTQPKAANVKAGKKVTFKVKASGYDLKYQWYYQKPGTSKWVKMSGKTKATLSFKAGKSKNGYKYRCLVKNEAGKTYTKTVKLTVK